MNRIALTGGPSAGKSTALRHLDATCGHSLTLVPEVATLLLQGGFPAPDEQYPWSIDWQRNFQLAIAITQIALEQTIETRAATNGQGIAVCDRGLADGAAYLPGGLNELSELIGYSKSSILGRYDFVIHLTSSVTHSSGYQKHTNVHRFEEAEEARKLEERTLEAWADHPKRLILDIEDSTTRNQSVVQAITEFA